MNVWKKGMIACLLGASFAFTESTAVAQAQPGPGWYAGISLGQSKAKDTDCAPGLSCDDTDSAWKIFGGYRINRTFAAELGYTDLGEFSASGGPVRASIESKAWELVGVGSFPVADRFALYGKAGLYRADTDATSNIGLSASETNTGLTFGLGAEYEVIRNVGLRAEWQRYRKVGGGDIKESDLDVLSVGALFKF